MAKHGWGQGCGNTKPDLSDLVPFHSGQVENFYLLVLGQVQMYKVKETRSVTMNIFRKKKILFKSFVRIELSYVFTINMFFTVENCMEK